MYNYPPFPSFSTSGNIGMDVASFILRFLLWGIEVLALGVVNLMLEILGGAAQGASGSANDVLGSLGKIFNQNVAAFKSLGIFAMPAAATLWGVSLVIIVFFVFKAIQVALSQTTQDV